MGENRSDRRAKVTRLTRLRLRLASHFAVAKPIFFIGDATHVRGHYDPGAGAEGPARRQFLLGRNAHRCLRLDNRRGIPSAGQRLGLRRVQAHRQIEWRPRRGKPVGFELLAGTVVLEVKIERTVRIVFERHPAAHRKAVQSVTDLESFLIVERDRPERIYRRSRSLLECYGVLVCAVERLAGFVAKI
jgi:hypothetical protein